jgi:hypothetical protein
MPEQYLYISDFEYRSGSSHPQFRHSNREILSNVPESTSSKRHHKIHFLPINVHLEYSTNDTFTGYFDIDTG